MKSEVEGNARRTDTCFLFFCLFFTRTHRLICLSFPPSFKHLSSSSPFVWYQHIWRYKKNCTGWWVGSWFHQYTEITVNVIYMLSVFSLIFCSALNFTTTRECPSDGTVPVTSGCWRPANVFCDAHEVVPLIYRHRQQNTHTWPSAKLPENLLPHCSRGHRSNYGCSPASAQTILLHISWHEVCV